MNPISSLAQTHLGCKGWWFNRITSKEKGGWSILQDKNQAWKDYIRKWGNQDSKVGHRDQESKLLLTMTNKYLKKNPRILVEELL